MGLAGLVRAFFGALARLLAWRNLTTDRFGTFAAIVGVALGTATVNVVLVLDVNTRQVESGAWASNPDLEVRADTITLRGIRKDGAPTKAKSVKEETHEDYEVMRSAIRLGSLSAFLVGALIVFFTFGVVVERRRREVGLLRSLGALPRDVAAIFVREAAVIGGVGAILGYVGAIPMAYVAARAGITTTGRSRISIWQLWFPWKGMGLVAVIGAATALLGVLRPARDVLRLDAAEALRPRFLAPGGPPPRARGVTLIALPFTLLVYILLRPFFKNAVPSLAFFLIEAGLVCAAFLATLIFVPDLVRLLSGLAARLVPRGTSAARLLAQRRVERAGHELSWSVSGVMLVFALLLALHVATRALTREVEIWAAGAITPYAFVTPRQPAPVGAPAPAEWIPERVAPKLPEGVAMARFSGRTPWPNPVHATPAGELLRWAEATGQPEIVATARRFGPGTIVLSKMMARRHRVAEGDTIEIAGRGGTRRLTVVGVTDDLGYTPTQGPYRNGKTYGVIDAADFALIAPYVEPMGSVLSLADAASRSPDWRARLAGLRSPGDVRWSAGSALEAARVRGTARDFVIFDVILALTSVLAAIGVANQMALGVHARRREIALYRVLGMTPSDVRKIVLFEGAFIGLVGGALAVLLGIPLGYAAIGALRAVSAFEVGFHLPASYVPLTIVGALVVSVVASLHPAARAARTDAAESVHYE